jgi:hypothetical protein
LELLCSLLTGFFCWLVIYHWRLKSVARWRHTAGELIYVAKSTRPRVLRRLSFVYFCLALAASIYSAVWRNHLSLESLWSVAAAFMLVLLLGIPAARHIALEVRERGVICNRVGDRFSAARFHFIPWNQIATCQWVAKSYGVASRFDDTHNCLTIADNAVLPDQKKAVTAALGQFAVVYDHDGTLLAEPDAEHLKAKWISWKDLDRPRFQFDLQTLLLLAVAVVCAANLCGVCYRGPRHQAIASLEAFGLEIDYVNDGVWELDFSGCATKPNDDDLANLEPLEELVRLDLSGAPITDAGLTHLKGLKKVHWINLKDTNVTDKGMADLRRALPKAAIDKYTTIRSTTPPVIAPPAKGK